MIAGQAHTGAVLPPLYAAWMRELLGGEIPPETEATCSDCAMCAPAGAADAADEYFHPRIKCCTYLPEIPNFLVGRILLDQDPAFRRGRATIEQRIEAGVAVTPLGLRRPSTYDLMYQQAIEVDGFGRALVLRCPHYLEDEGGRCGIWRHRYSVCATWFCKHVRGAVGFHFWRTMLQLLAAIEHDLTRWTILELDVGAGALRNLVPHPGDPGALDRPIRRAELDGEAPARIRRGLWGTWHGREREFFVACARLVDPLCWPDVLRISGQDVHVQAKLAAEAFAALTSLELPASLTMGRFEMSRAGRRTVRLRGYSPLDQIDVPREVVDVLHFFTGRPTREALTAIERERGLCLEPPLVRGLADFNILVPAT